MPELAPVTRAFWPDSVLRISQLGMTTGGRSSSAIRLRISGVLVFRLIGFAAARLQQLRDQAGPAGLVRGAHPAPAVAVEVLVEQDVVPKMGIALQLRLVAENRPP